MIVQPDIQFKELAAATAGELVRFDLRGASALAVVMRQTDKGTVCAFLETHDEPRPPFFMIMSIEDLMCISYGSEWLLDLVYDANSFPGNGLHAQRHGTIHVGHTTLAINLNRPPDDIRMNASSFDLKTFRTVDVHQRTCVPVTSWKIWHTAADKHEGNASPLFEFKMLEEPAPRR